MRKVHVGFSVLTGCDATADECFETGFEAIEVK